MPAQISKQLNQHSISGVLKRNLLSLRDDGLIEHTMSDKPNSRLQRYRLTAAGRRFLSDQADK